MPYYISICIYITIYLSMIYLFRTGKPPLSRVESSGIRRGPNYQGSLHLYANIAFCYLISFYLWVSSYNFFILKSIKPLFSYELKNFFGLYRKDNLYHYKLKSKPFKAEVCHKGQMPMFMSNSRIICPLYNYAPGLILNSMLF